MKPPKAIIWFVLLAIVAIGAVAPNSSPPTIAAMFGTNATPADATTYYFGGVGTGGTGSVIMATTADRRRFTIPFACRITKAYVTVINDGGTAGTTETSTVNLRLNNSSDTVLTSALVTNAAGTFASGALSIAIAAGDNVEVKWVAPTWATNPTNVCVQVTLELRP